MARYSVRQVAELWGVSPHTVYNLVERRELSCVRIGRSVRIRDEDIEEYETKCHQPATQNPANDNRPSRVTDLQDIARRIRSSGDM